MKKVLNLLIALFTLVSFSSCLDSGLDELPAFDEAMIKNFKFEYRWFDDAKNRMSVVQMNVQTSVDNENFTVSCNIKVPAANANFPSNIREQVSLSNLVGYCEISTAAVIVPIGNSPKLGEIQNFAKDTEMSYKVTAANGDSNIWKLKIVGFSK